MAICETQLWELVKSIEPTQTQKEDAKVSQNHLRDILCTGKMQERIIEHYLSGSYARKTAIYPLDDVDIIFIIDPAFWVNKIADAASYFFFGSGAFPSADAVLSSFANAVRYRYADSSLRRQRRSVGLKLDDLDIDIVPAIEDATDPKRIWIPDSTTGQWILSSPKQHSENATAVNQMHEGRFKPLVKLLKRWNYNLPGTAYFKSFAIETIAVRLFSQNDLISLQEGLYQFFDFIAFISGNETHLDWENDYGMSLRWLDGNIPDTAETGTNVVNGLDNSRRRKFIENALRSRNKMSESFNARSLEATCRRVSEALKL